MVELGLHECRLEIHENTISIFEPDRSVADLAELQEAALASGRIASVHNS